MSFDQTFTKVPHHLWWGLQLTHHSWWGTGCGAPGKTNKPTRWVIYSLDIVPTRIDIPMYAELRQCSGELYGGLAWNFYTSHLDGYWVNSAK